MKLFGRRKTIPSFDILPEDVLFPAQKELLSLNKGVPQPDIPLSTRLLRGFYVVILATLLAFSARTASITIFEHQRLSVLAAANSQTIFWEQAPRGVVFDRNGQQLMVNVPRTDLLLLPQELPRRPGVRSEMAQKLAPLLNRDPAAILAEIPSLKQIPLQTPKLIARDLTQEQVIKIESNLEQLPGLRIVRGSRRRYLDGPVLAHLLGYTGRVSKDDLAGHPNYLPTDNVGKIGIEARYDELLRGRHGYQVFEKTARGQQTRLYQEAPARPGQNLMLTIDASLQKKAGQALEKALKKLGVKKGAVVALAPDSGEVLALVSKPSYDPNLFARGLSANEYLRLENDPDQPLFNRAVSGTYPPGSTIKPVIAAAALEEKVVDPDYQLFVTGAIQVPSIYDPGVVYTFRDWKPHGWVNLRRAIAVSSNVFFYTIGGGYGEVAGLGIAKLEKYTRLFGLGAITGIDLPGETTGRIPNPQWKEATKREKWYIGDTYNFSIGQGDITVTPLQMATATAVFANGGYRVQPHLLKSVVDEKGVPEDNQQSSFWEKINLGLSRSTLDLVRGGMWDAVHTGTAGLIFNSPVPAAGKTGTAQFGVEGKTHAWFTVFAPFEKPEIVVTVLIEGTREGSFGAIPVASEILNYYFSR